MEQHLMSFKKVCQGKAEVDYEIILKEYYKYKETIMNVETKSWIALAKHKNKLHKIKSDCGTLYKEIYCPFRMFPRIVAMSNELREVLDFKKIARTKVISEQRIDAIDMSRFYKLLKIVYCYGNSWDLEDFLSTHSSDSIPIFSGVL